MRVIIDTPTSNLEEDIFNISGAKASWHVNGVEIREVIAVRESNRNDEFEGLAIFDLIIIFVSKDNKIERIGMRKNEFTEIRVYAD